MKQTLIMIASILAVALASCNNSGDKSMYLQAQMVNHMSNVEASEEEPGTIRTDAVVYEVILDTDNKTADVACTVTLPDGKRGTIDVRGLTLSVDSKTGGYYMKQTASSRSQGSYAVTDFAGVLDLSSSGSGNSHFSFVVEKHYQVNAVIAEITFSNVKAEITNGEAAKHSLSGGVFTVTLNPSNKTAKMSIKGLDYDGEIGKERALVYENLDFVPCVGGYELTAEEVAPATNGDAALAKKYTLKDFKAKLKFFGQIEASYSIDGVGEVKAAN